MRRSTCAAGRFAARPAAWVLAWVAFASSAFAKTPAPEAAPVAVPAPSEPLPPPAAPGPPRAFAIVVAGSRSDQPGTPPLRFADDDAARYAELFSLAAADVELFAVFDEETQARHPSLVERARVPRRDEVLEAIDRVHARISEARSRGERTVLYFAFAGHGHVGDNREGYLALHDGRLTRSDLYRRVIAASRADSTHLILDACNAYFLVAGRGSKASAAIQRVIDGETLDRYPTVGVLVATTSSAEVHEWAKFAGGVFSHEVRSALMGGADVDADRRITYAEVGAFVAAANARVRDPRGKLSILAVPPRANREQPIVDWSGNDRAAFLSIEAPPADRFYVEDERGVRVADLFPSPGERFVLALSPGRTHFARGNGWESRWSPLPGDTQALAALDRRDPDLGARGGIAEEFERGLFAVPYGAAFFQGFVEAHPEGLLPTGPVPLRGPARWSRPTAWSLLGAGGLFGTWSVWTFAEAEKAADRYRYGFGTADEIEGHRREARAKVERSRILAGVGVVSAATSVWLFHVSGREAAFAVEAGPGGVGAALTLTFGGGGER